MKSAEIGKTPMMKKNDKKHPAADEKEKEIADLKRQVEELTNKWKRALADYQNLEKRVRLEKEESAKYASQSIMTKLLSVLDILEQAEKHIKDQGLSLAVKSFKDVLSEEGIVKLEVLNKKFNPHEMECVEVVEGNEDDLVTEELRPGYKLGDKIIRVAQVKVSKKK